MSEEGWNGMLTEAACQVLETMFFADAQPIAGEVEFDGTPCRSARVNFAGTPGGALTVAVSDPALQVLASNFLPSEESDRPPASQLDAVMCELANMICGSMLSAVRTETHFKLSSPQLFPFPAAKPNGPPNRSLNLGAGAIHMWLALESHAG